MDRKESSRLGDLQAEGNLGNERTRNSGRRDEDMRNRSSEGGMRERGRDSEDAASREEWSPSETHDNNDARNSGRDR
jgi:hypothetical protein